MASPASNRGWTIFGKTYHEAVYWLGTHRYHPPRRCNAASFLDQTERNRNGEPTGALVPEDLRPCKRCFPHGDPR